MGLLKSYRTFMASNAIEQTFSAYESDNPDDTVAFSRLYQHDFREGTIKVVSQGDSVTITKTAEDQPSIALPGSSNDTPSLSASDTRAKYVQKTPWRVSLASLKRRIKTEEVIHPACLPHMTIVIIVLDNGYALQGMSAPADPDNYDEQKGIEFAREDALRKMWPLEAYVMRDYLSGNVVGVHSDPNTRWAE